MATIPSGRPVDLPPPTMGGSEWDDWEPPTDGWHTLTFVGVRDDKGEIRTREKQWQGNVQPGKYQVLVRYTVAGGADDAKEWVEWLSWSLADLAPMRWIVNAIRKGKPFDPKIKFDLLPYENKRFDAFILVNEVPSRDDPTKMKYFPKIKKCKAVGTAAPPDDEEEGDVPAPTPTRNGSKAPNPFTEEIDF